MSCPVDKGREKKRFLSVKIESTEISRDSHGHAWDRFAKIDQFRIFLQIEVTFCVESSSIVPAEILKMLKLFLNHHQFLWSGRSMLSCTCVSIHPGWVEPASPIELTTSRMEVLCELTRDFHPEWHVDQRRINEAGKCIRENVAV